MEKLPKLSPLDPKRERIVSKALDFMASQYHRDKDELAKMAKAGKSYSAGAAKLLARQPEFFNRELAEYNYRMERGWA